jgi:glycosyltransferase involved in cell wall biosynthesis
MILSVRLQCFNHGLFIESALQSVLSQETSFPFEVVVGDDFSTDNSIEIIEKVIRENTNTNITFHLLKRVHGDLYSIQRKAKGRLYNFYDILNNCKGKYIALLDGDDYWTDPLKLQKQVDFLEKNGGYAICAHNVNELNTFTGLVAIKPGKTKLIDYNLDNYIINNKTPACSLVFEKKYLKLDIGFPEWFCKVNFGDWAIVLMILKNSGKLCAVLPDVMGTYRIHANGIHGKLYQDSKAFRSAFKEHLRFIKTLRKELLYEKKHKLLIVKKRIKIHKRLYKLNLECKNFSMALIHQIKRMYYKLEFKLTLKNH